MVSVVMGTTFGDPISDDHFGSQDDIPQIDTSWCWIGMTTTTSTFTDVMLSNAIPVATAPWDA